MAVGVRIRRTGTGKPRVLARVKPRMPKVIRGMAYIKVSSGRRRTA